MTINAMRCYILDSYPHASKEWRFKVAHTMPYNQICAIYHSIVNRKMNHKKTDPEDEQYHQIDIFEYMAKKEAACE